MTSEPPRDVTLPAHEQRADDVREALFATARERLRAHLREEAADAGASPAVAEVQAFLERVRPTTSTD